MNWILWMLIVLVWSSDAVAQSTRFSGGGSSSFDGVIMDGTGDTNQMNVINGRAQVQNYNENLSADNSTNSTAKVPVIVCKATATAPTWTEGAQVPCLVDLNGRQYVRTGCALGDIVSAVVTATSGANTSGIAAQGAGVKTYLSQVIIYNNGSSNGSLLITDGSGGTTKLKVPFPASTGTTINLALPIGFTANTAIYVDPSGSDNIDVTLIGCKSSL